MNNSFSNENQTEYQNVQKNKVPIFLLVIIGVIVIIVIIVALIKFLNNNDDSVDNYYTPPTYEQNPSTIPPSTNITDTTITSKVYGFNETFIFDNLQITIGSNYGFDVVKNRFSEYNNKTVVKLPITVKNISNETHGLNMFYYDIYGSMGTSVKTLNSYFDDTLDFSGDLRPNASYTKYTYFLYDGDGTYAIEFDNYSEEITAEFDIKK